MRKLCWVLGTVIILYVLVGVVCDILIWAEWRRIAREGDPVSLAQLADPMPPASENGALVYEKAFRLMHSGQFRTLWDLSFEKELERDPAVWAQAEKELPGFTPVLELARKASSMPTCVFRADNKTGKIPIISEVRIMAKYIRGYALLNAHNGLYDRAFSALRLSVGVGDSLESNPFYIILLTRAAIYRDASDMAYRMACYGSINQDKAQSLCDSLGQGGFATQLQTAMKWERVNTFELLDRTGTRGLPYDYRDYAGNPQVRFECSWIGRPILRADEFSFLLRQRHTIRNAATAFRNLPKARDLSECHTCHHRRSIWPLSSMFEIGTDPFNPYPGRKHVDYTKTRINGARICLAMRIYKQRYGAFPDKLAELGKLGWKLDLTDPFTGCEFSYKRIGEGFLLYSIGPNLKDDGGRPDPLDTWDQGDIVWKMKS